MCRPFALFLLFSVLSRTWGHPIIDNDIYWKLRNEMLHIEDKLAIGGDIRLDPLENKTNAILVQYKQKEVDAGFKNPETFLPAYNFMLKKNEIDKSDVFKLIKEMPKGAVLHVHEFGMVSSDFVFNKITYLPNLYLCDKGFIKFLVFHSKSEMNCQLVSTLRQDPRERTKIDAMIKSMLSMEIDNPNEVYTNVNTAWKKFGSIFLSITPMLTYRPVFEQYLYQGLLEMYEDNVMYVEVRTTLPDLYELDGTKYTGLEVAKIFKKVSDNFITKYHDFLGMRIIYAPLRNVNTQKCEVYIQTAEYLRKQYPNFVVGFDLVGQEDKGAPLKNFVDKFRADIPYIFHAGETSWDGLSTDLNLIDAILLKAKRIGHGYAVLKHPQVLSKLKENDIPIEVNPISNQVLKLSDDLRNHPASFLFANNYPVVVSCDDPGLWGAKGLSYDFYEAFVGIMSLNADLRALKQLAINSINYSSLSNSEKKFALKIWTKKWNAYLSEVIKMHSKKLKL